MANSMKHGWYGLSMLLLLVLLGAACSEFSDSGDGTLSDEPEDQVDGDKSGNHVHTDGDAAKEDGDSASPDGDSGGTTDGDEPWTIDGDEPYMPDGDELWTIDGDENYGESCVDGDDNYPIDGDDPLPADGDEAMADGDPCIDGDVAPADGDTTIDGDIYFEDGDAFEAEAEKEAPVCPDTQEPLVLYLSSDDSSSQASPILTRALMKAGWMVPAEKIRIYEFLNYYNLNYDNPRNVPAQAGFQIRPNYREEGIYTLLSYVQGRKIEAASRRPFNLVFSLDTSGSMEGHALDMTKAILYATAAVLKEGDRVSVVRWSDRMSILMDSYAITGPNDTKLIALANSLDADGSTNLYNGLAKAYELAGKNYNANRINRVILISDGGANTGITDIDLIAENAEDANKEGIYLLGVGVDDDAMDYNETLMNDVTEAGKGAYLYVDTINEANRMFGDPERFLSIIEIAARNVQMEVTLPWYMRMEEFHGEEWSTDPEEVEPQHLAPNDAMSFHQILRPCDPSLVNLGDTIRATARFKDPASRQLMENWYESSIGNAFGAQSRQLRKADLIVAYAEILQKIWRVRYSPALKNRAMNEAQVLLSRLESEILELKDPELQEIHDLLHQYITSPIRY